MSKECFWNEKRQRIVTLQEHKNDGFTFVKNKKLFSFVLTSPIEVSVRFGQAWKVGHTLQMIFHINWMKKLLFFYIFAIIIFGNTVLFGTRKKKYILESSKNKKYWNLWLNKIQNRIVLAIYQLNEISLFVLSCLGKKKCCLQMSIIDF